MVTIPKDDDQSSGAPLSAIRDALEEQTTEELMDQAQQYAQTRVILVRSAGIPVSKTYARELADDAHADTWSGDLPWDPSQCSLLVHLCHAIQYRTWAELRHMRRVHLVLLHGSANVGTTSREIEYALAHATQAYNPALLCAISATACQELRHLIAHDHEASAVLECWEDGIMARDEVMGRTGLSGRAYEQARKRLLYMSRYLTPALRESAQDLLRSTS